MAHGRPVGFKQPLGYIYVYQNQRRVRFDVGVCDKKEEVHLVLCSSVQFSVPSPPATTTASWLIPHVACEPPLTKQTKEHPAQATRTPGRQPPWQEERARRHTHPTSPIDGRCPPLYTPTTQQQQESLVEIQLLAFHLAASREVRGTTRELANRRVDLGHKAQQTVHALSIFAAVRCISDNISAASNVDTSSICCSDSSTSHRKQARMETGGGG